MNLLVPRQTKSIRWHPSLTVGPGSDPHGEARRAEEAVGQYGLGGPHDGSAASVKSRRAAGRLALASMALVGLFGMAIASVVASGSSLSELRRSLGSSWMTLGSSLGVGGFGNSRPMFDPETYAAEGLSYEQRMSGAGPTFSTTAAAASGGHGRSLRQLLSSGRGPSGGEGGRPASGYYTRSELEKERRESAEGYRKLQSLPFGASEGMAAQTDDRSVVQTITAYDTTIATGLPEFYAKFANVWDTLLAQDQPMLWYVPKAGGNTLSKIFSHCLGMVTCSSMASTVAGGLDPPATLMVNTFPDGTKYINADPSTLEGIQKATDGGLVSTRAAAVIITQRLQASEVMFTVSNKGRLFVMLRHPIKRVVDQFYYRQRATWEAGFDASLATMSLEQFASSDRLVENFVVRSLVHKVTTDVTAADVELAKNVLRQKFVVGIAEWFDLSVVRFEKYFGWWDEHNVLTNMTVNHCHFDQIQLGGHVGAHPKAEAGSEAYKKIAVRNWADLELYFYAKQLFYRQQALVA